MESLADTDDGGTLGDENTVTHVGSVVDTREAEAILDALSEDEDDDEESDAESHAGSVENEGYKGREWCCTIWEGSTGVHPFSRFDQLRSLFERGKPIIIRLAAGKEFGSKDGNPHLQFFIEFKDSKKLSYLRRLIPYGCNWKKRLAKSSTWSAVKYCLKGAQPSNEWKRKENGRVDGPNYGKYDESRSNVPGYDRDDFLLFLGPEPERPVVGKKKGKQGDRNDVYPIQCLLDEGKTLNELTAMREYCKTIARFDKHFTKYYLKVAPKYNHHKIRGIMMVGDFGVGKSQIIRDIFDPNNEGLIYLKSHNKWWNGYDREPFVLMDELPIDSGFDLNQLKHWADMYHCHGEEKFGHVNLVHKCFILTSNHTFKELVEDRWKNKNSGFKNQLIGALERRFDIFEYTNYSRVTVNEELLKLKASHLVSPEEQKEHIEASRYLYHLNSMRIEVIRKQGCPEHQYKQALYLEDQIANNVGLEKERYQQQYDVLRSNWRYVAPIMLPEPKVLKKRTVDHPWCKLGVLTSDAIAEYTPPIVGALVTPSEQLDDDVSLDSSAEVDALLNDESNEEPGIDFTLELASGSQSTVTPLLNRERQQAVSSERAPSQTQETVDEDQSVSSLVLSPQNLNLNLHNKRARLN